MVKYCLLNDNKLCDGCGECERCELDPNKLCDNCGKCLALEDEEKEFRSFVVKKDGLAREKGPDIAPIVKKRAQSAPVWESDEEPTELTPELIAYWERILIEHGEAPADDGFGEIEVSTRIPVHGKKRKQ